MAVLGQNIAAMPEELAAFDNGSEAAVGSNKDPALLELDRHSQTDIQDFATGAFQLLNQRDIHSRDWLSLSHREQNEAIAGMDSGEALSTFNIMQNPIMEELASRHATDALAFANDVMINLSHIELKQQLAQFVPTGFEDADDEDLTPDARRRKQAEQNMQNLAQAMSEIHEERMEEQMRLERWDKNMHTIGGQQFSGADLHNLYLFVQDPANFDKFKQSLQKDGVPKEEAEKRAEKLKRTLELLEKERQGKLTEEEKSELAINKRDKQVAADLADLKKMEENGRGITYNNEHTEIEAATTTGTQASTSIRSSILANTSDISEPKGQATTTASQPSIFSAVPSGIQTEVALTSTYNNKAASSITVETPANAPKEEPQQKTAASPAGNFGFG
ncbi:MAG: hypothetical protein PHX61_07245 [Alphaproteobacteria bacterium]|nr:hypothetical protein [Alphaproteobacteria bacterium]